MKAQIEQLLHSSIAHLQKNGSLPADINVNIQLTRSKDENHGDFASNIALLLAKPAGILPRQLAHQIVAALPASELVRKTEIAGPGFINFFIQKAVTYDVIKHILDRSDGFGQSHIGAGKKVLLEFVSANPTGPLHVGHGRGAAYGQTLANLLTTAGFKVDREYYVNDAGRQMNILATSVWIRYLELNGLRLPFPANGYRGDYIYDIAKMLKADLGDKLLQTTINIQQNLPPDETEGGDKEIYIDAFIERCRKLLGESDYRTVFDYGLKTILEDIREDLEEFGVEFETWFYESSLTDSGAVQNCIQKLQEAAYLYKKGGALWFKSTDFGDEKDRVVQRDNGQITYFASDIAYHINKLERGYDRIIDIWGADHHGYITRVRAAIAALSNNASRFEVLLVQFANLYRGQEKISMSTRSGEFVTLRALREEVGRDAARFYYSIRRCEQHMDFDLELAKSQSKDNPVYYVQYAHARIANVFNKLTELQLQYNEAQGRENLALLNSEHEERLIMTLLRYPEVIETAAANEEPHQVVFFLRDLANDLHKYYDAQKILIEDENLRNARLTLAKATQQILKNALKLIGVSAPDSM